MNSYQSILSKSVLFQGIEESQIQEMLCCLSAFEKTYQKNDFILHAGDLCTKIGIVLCGEVHIVKEDFWGNRDLVANIQPGDLFAESFACISLSPLPVSAVAAQDCTVVFLDFHKITTTCSSACVFHTTMIENMLKLLAQKNMLLMQKIDYLSKRSTKEKLLSYLSEQAIKSKSNCFTIPFNRQELADYLAVDRSAMSSELSKLKDEGKLLFHKNQFELKN